MPSHKPNFRKHRRATPQQSNEGKSEPKPQGEDILSRFSNEAARLGLVGETQNAQIIFLALITRIFPRPVSVVVKGARSSGKNTLVETVLKFFPPRTYFTLSAMSEKALPRFSHSLKNKFLVITEAAGLPQGAEYFLRTLLSEGHIKYEVVVGGKASTVEIEGPTGLLMTTTANRLYEDNETRLISIELDDNRSHTRQVLRSIGKSFANPGQEEAVVSKEWHRLLDRITTNAPLVAVPYAESVADLMLDVDSRLNRDAKALLGLVSAHALLHRDSRSLDDQGRLIATITDYEAVRLLVHSLIAYGVETSVTPSVRRVVEAVKLLATNGKGVSVTEIAAKLQLNKAGASRHCTRAKELGFIANREERPGRSHSYVPDAEIPDDVPAIPTASAVLNHHRSLPAANNVTPAITKPKFKAR